MAEGLRSTGSTWRAGLGLLLTVACSGGGGTADPVAVASVTVQLAAAQLLVGQTANATAIPKASNGSALTGRSIAWQSNDPTVATVAGSGASAVVTAVGAGTTTIKATSEGIVGTSPSLTVSVPPDALTALTALPPTITLVTLGATQQITTTPTTATGATVVYANSSSTPAVATVTTTGANPTVTAVTAGTTTITIQATGSGTGLTTTSITRTVAVTVTPGCVELAADANTIALYHFNEGTGQQFNNSAGITHNGTLGPDVGTNQDPDWLATGKIGSALRFTRGGSDATNDYALVNVASTFPTNQASVELYVRPRAPYGHSVLMSTGTINYYVAINSNGVIEFGIGDGNTWHIINAPSPNLNDGNWHQVATTYNGATMKVYVDGVERLSTASTTVLANPPAFYFGGRPSNTFLNGDIDEVRISRIARTGAEIAANYCP